MSTKTFNQHFLSSDKLYLKILMKWEKCLLAVYLPRFNSYIIELSLNWLGEKKCTWKKAGTNKWKITTSFAVHKIHKRGILKADFRSRKILYQNIAKIFQVNRKKTGFQFIYFWRKPQKLSAQWRPLQNLPTVFNGVDFQIAAGERIKHFNIVYGKNAVSRQNCCLAVT